MYVIQIIILWTLKLYSAVRQLYLNETRSKNQKKCLRAGALSLSLLCEDTVKRRPSTSQEDGSHQELNRPTP